MCVFLQCVLFGVFMIWFASITINLGPTFLSGALAANSEAGHNAPSCPLVHGPLRHYVLNLLWIVINVICVGLTLFHLHKVSRFTPQQHSSTAAQQHSSRSGEVVEHSLIVMCESAFSNLESNRT